jgi:hypothetical protein
MEAACFFETSINSYHDTWCHILHCKALGNYSCQNLKSQIIFIFISFYCSYRLRRSGVRHSGCTGGTPHLCAICRGLTRPGHLCLLQWTDVSIVQEEKHRHHIQFDLAVFLMNVKAIEQYHVHCLLKVNSC